MKARYHYRPVLLAGCLILLLHVTAVIGNARKNDAVRYENGLLSVHPNGASIMEVLKQIADLVDIKIYLIDDDGKDMMMVSVDGLPPSEAIPNILRNKNYVAIFGKTFDPGIEMLTGKKGEPTGNIEVNVPDEGAIEHEKDDDHEERIKEKKKIYEKASLKAEIKRLEKRIESGEADKWYDRESKIKSRVVHPRDELAQLKEKLSELSSE